MEFKITTAKTISLDSPKLEKFKSEADYIADVDGYVDLTQTEIGKQYKVYNSNPEKNLGYLNIYKRIN